MKKLAIVGGGVTKLRAPFSSDIPIWSTMSVGQDLPRCDVIFELHDDVYTPEQLNATGKIIYLKKDNPKIPLGKPFPIEILIHRYGKHFNGTIVMMLAFSVIEGYNEIDIYGVDFSSDAEFGRRAMFMYMVGFFVGKGIKINFCDGGYLTDTCKTYMYEDNGMAFIEDMRVRVKDQYDQDTSNVIALDKRAAYAKGALDTLANIERRFL
jgi:hypothetical protein